jgi:hypothetical protein
MIINLIPSFIPLKRSSSKQGKLLKKKKGGIVRFAYFK